MFSESKEHIVCISNVFKSLNWCNENSKNYWIKYLNLNRGKIYKIINKKKNTMNSSYSTLYRP
ncbi:GT-D fold domain-containing glycosyltransferase [Neobacillus cucumis]|uniref:GT-D fold domain-containing glycosyltransferase n=1 Tax=Neobacillus cucumis TaxID=1740721 RepID=UPI0019657F48